MHQIFLVLGVLARFGDRQGVHVPLNEAFEAFDALQDMPPDLLMGYATGYSADVIDVFINTFQRVSPARIVLFTRDGVWPRGLECHRPDQVTVVSIRALGLSRAVRQMPAVTQRFYAYQQWLARHGSAYGRIIVADVRDTFFQSDPFDSVRRAEQVYLFEEGVSLQHEPYYNQPWIRDCAGQATLDHLLAQDPMVVCAGVIAAGTVRAFAALLDALVPLLARGCNDQGALNIVAPQIQHPRIKRMPMAASFVANALQQWNPGHPDAHIRTKLVPLHVRRDRIGRVLNANGHPYAIVHQADRDPALWQLRLRLRGSIPAKYDIHKIEAATA